jgi:hypothetical protein
MKAKSRSPHAKKKTTSSTDMVTEEITKAAQTAQLLRSDLGAAYKAAADPLLQIVLLRIMKLSADLQSELVQVEAAMQDRPN